MPLFTAKELELFNNMAKGLINCDCPYNMINYFVGYNRWFGCDELSYLYLSEDIEKYQDTFVMQNTYNGIAALEKLCEDCPIEDMPLHINDKNTLYKIVSLWRLKIGK